MDDIRELIEELKTKDHLARKDAIDKIINKLKNGSCDVEKIDVDQLIGALPTAEPDGKAFLAKLMGETGDLRAVPALLNSLKGTDEGTECWSIWALNIILTIKTISKEDTRKLVPLLMCIINENVFSISEKKEYERLTKSKMPMPGDMVTPSFDTALNKKNHDVIDFALKALEKISLREREYLPLYFEALAFRNPEKLEHTITKCKTLFELQDIKTGLHSSLHKIRKKFKKETADILWLRTYFAELEILLAAKKDALTQKLDIILDDVPKAPKGGYVYQQLRRRTFNG